MNIRSLLKDSRVYAAPREISEAWKDSSTTVDSETIDSGSGFELVQRYVAIHVPQVGVGHYDRQELEAAERVIRRSIAAFLSTIAAVVGYESLEQRLADLGTHNTISDSRIPVIYVPRPSHSHNMLAGVPYTGVFLGRFPQMPFITAHEMGHIVFGKFNDGLTEPLASLFVKRTPPGKRGVNHPLKLPFNKLITLAALELFDEGVQLADLGSVEDLFSHRPLYRLIAQQRYEFEKRRVGGPREAAQATQQFVATLFRSNYHEDFAAHTSLDVRPPNAAEEHELDRWFEEFATNTSEARRRNPNESRGVVRNFHGLIDTALTEFLLGKGLPEGETPECCTSEGAHESLQKLLEFYYAPQASLSLYGCGTFGDLESEMRSEFQEIDGDQLRQMFAWYQLKDDLRTSPCYQPGTWDDCCSAPGPGGDAGEAVLRFARAALGPRPRPDESPPALHPIVAKAVEQPAQSPLISLTEKLGKDLDFETYFSLIAKTE